MKIPFNYPLCTLGECPKADECLRYMAMTESNFAKKWWKTAKVKETFGGKRHFN